MVVWKISLEGAPDKVAPHKGADASKGVKQDTTIPKKGKADKMDKGTR